MFWCLSWETSEVQPRILPTKMPSRKHNSFFQVFKPYLQTSIDYQTADALSSFVFIQLTAHDSISKEITSTSAAMWIWLNSCIPSCNKRFQLPRVKCDNVTAFTLSVFSDLLPVKHGRNCCGECTMFCTQIIVCVHFYLSISSLKCSNVLKSLGGGGGVTSHGKN